MEYYLKYWWVNQGGSYEIEHANDFMWSPQKEKNGRRNQAYENMKEISPGDIIFSHFNSRIASIGRAQTYCYESPRPIEFPKDQNEGNLLGWKVDVIYAHGVTKFQPKIHFEEIFDLLPLKYSPLDKNGQAAMKLYLTSITEALANRIMGFMNLDVSDFPLLDLKKNTEERRKVLLEESIVLEIQNEAMPETEKLNLVYSRFGQALFKDRVSTIENMCRVSGIKNREFLIASHIKPWRDSNNQERLDGENGLLLSPNIDRLFDRYFISFSDEGHLLISPLITTEEKILFGLVDDAFIGKFTEGQKRYLLHHRERLRSAKKEE
jgi:putative restriction endonuclease